MNHSNWQFLMILSISEWTSNENTYKFVYYIVLRFSVSIKLLHLAYLKKKNQEIFQTVKFKTFQLLLKNVQFTNHSVAICHRNLVVCQNDVVRRTVVDGSERYPYKRRIKQNVQNDGF